MRAHLPGRPFTSGGAHLCPPPPVRLRTGRVPGLGGGADFPAETGRARQGHVHLGHQHHDLRPLHEAQTVVRADAQPPLGDLQRAALQRAVPLGRAQVRQPGPGREGRGGRGRARGDREQEGRGTSREGSGEARAEDSRDNDRPLQVTRCWWQSPGQGQTREPVGTGWPRAQPGAISRPPQSNAPSVPTTNLLP